MDTEVQFKRKNEMNLHETTKKQNHSGVYFTKQGLFSEEEKKAIEKRELFWWLVILMTRKLGSICPPSAPPKPRPASSVNQTLVQGLGETEMDRQTEK